MENRQEIYCDNCLNILPQLNNITAIVTDPPYGLQFMGKKWDHGIPGVEYWQAIKGACLPGAWLLAFGGTRTFHRLAVAIEDAGWEIKDTVMWVYGSGFPKSRNIGKAVDGRAGVKRKVVGRKADPRYNSPASATSGAPLGNLDPRPNSTTNYDKAGDITGPATSEAEWWEPYGTALKPAWEPIIVAQKPIEKNYAENALRYGAGGLNIDGCRIALTYECNLDTIQRQHAKSHIDFGGANPGDTIDTYKPQGRWPANLIHDGSEEVLELFPQTGGGKFTVGGTPRKTDGFVCTGSPDRSEAIMNYGDSGSAARFFYCAKASKPERTASNNHPTVKPLALMRYLLTLIKQPENNLVLDPFMGSGSTLVAAKQLGLPAIGIDNDEQSCEIARNRLANFIL